MDAYAYLRGVVRADGLFTYADAVGSGVSSRTLTQLCRVGSITRVARGVYAYGGTPVGSPAARTRSFRGVLSHFSASAWWDVELPYPVPAMDISVARCRGRWRDELPGVRFHRQNLSKGDIELVRHVPVTSPLRTCIDIARTQPMAVAVAIIDGFLRRGLVSDLVAPADGRGAGAVRAAMANADAKAGSILESLWRIQFLEAGLPAPSTQVSITHRGQWIGRVDFAWRESRVIVECDGFRWHSGREKFVRDRRRWNALTRAGWRVVILTWADLADPKASINLIRDLLNAHS